MKTILVPIDFSQNTNKALSAAKQIASKTGAKLLIMFAYQPYLDDFALPDSVSALPVYQELEDSYREKLNACVSQLQQEGYRADAVWETDGVEPAVLRQASETNASMIVVGRSGAGSLLDKLIGSSATGIALHATCPVLIVPPQATTTNFSKVLYATELEFEEKEVLLDVISLVKQLNGQLTLVKINSDQQLNIQSDKQHVDEIQKELGIGREDIVILDGEQVMKSLEDYCDKVHADLLIVSTRQRGFLEKFLSPGLTKKLTLDTHLPLLVYHQKVCESQFQAPMVIL
ncbi:universal stress protein [Dyadobacter arcticus]|uniref:Nucleotide-binding universal stress UspA family protein n=1 Tax=Dyadobacter arcticus TaxID=1078754 RepID=A0ABX0ULP9_9BACT|nr:universal stress protein [Dyadobacter arcticus]NIJ52560.1 nucleotide-binding universal stress UspA family protein [Dyadobacter arcticus]